MIQCGLLNGRQQSLTKVVDLIRVYKFMAFTKGRPPYILTKRY
jgi:hypothetical protein